MLTDGLIALVQADPGCTALIAGRIYEGELPRGYTLPAVAIHKYGGNRDTQFSGPVGIRETQIQFDTYGRTALEARQVAQAIDSLVAPFAGALPDGTVVQLCTLERDMDMPFKADGDAKSVFSRSTLGYRIITEA
jgi:Protein of unknown function (DUF3168)